MSQNPAAGATQLRLRAIVLWVATILAVVALGLFVRFVIAEPFSDVLGGMLYTVLIAVILSPLVAYILRRRMPARPRAWRNRHWITAGLALAVSVGIELLQLSSIPAHLASVFPPARLVFGTSFAPLDILAYCGGALLFGVCGALAAAIRAKARLSSTMPITTASSSESRGP